MTEETLVVERVWATKEWFIDHPGHEVSTVTDVKIDLLAQTLGYRLEVRIEDPASAVSLHEVTEEEIT